MIAKGVPIGRLGTTLGDTVTNGREDWRGQERLTPRQLTRRSRREKANKALTVELTEWRKIKNAFEDYLATDGFRCLQPFTGMRSGDLVYMRNRLERAFMAGLRFGQARLRSLESRGEQKGEL